MASNKKPMTVLSIEAVLGQMKMEKLWEIRKENSILKRISDRTPFDQTRKWMIRSIVIEKDNIVSLPGQDLIKMNGTKQTKWVSPQILSLIDSNSHIIKNSILPVSITFCRKVRSLVIHSTKTESNEYIELILQLINSCSSLVAICLHIPSITEAHLLQLLNSLKLKDESQRNFRISLNSSAELTPKFIHQFSIHSGIHGHRMILVRQPENGEVETLKRAAILQFFLDYHSSAPAQTMTERAMIFERMDREIAHSIIEDLQRLYEEGKRFYENGSLAFYLGRPGSCVQLEIRNLDNVI